MPAWLVNARKNHRKVMLLFSQGRHDENQSILDCTSSCSMSLPENSLRECEREDRKKEKGYEPEYS